MVAKRKKIPVVPQCTQRHCLLCTRLPEQGFKKRDREEEHLCENLCVAHIFTSQKKKGERTKRAMQKIKEAHKKNSKRRWRSASPNENVLHFLRPGEQGMAALILKFDPGVRRKEERKKEQDMSDS